jgi:hypothetical protein
VMGSQLDKQMAYSMDEMLVLLLDSKLDFPMVRRMVIPLESM